MGLLDRFKSSNAPTQKGLTAKEWCDKGDALAKSGRHEEALQCFDQALAIDPTNAIAQQGKPVAVEKTRKTTPKKQSGKKTCAMLPLHN
jgi:tetratricopeptide (TPR) repeat protein